MAQKSANTKMDCISITNAMVLEKRFFFVEMNHESSAVQFFSLVFVLLLLSSQCTPKKNHHKQRTNEARYKGFHYQRFSLCTQFLELNETQRMGR